MSTQTNLLGVYFQSLADEISSWSQFTFGTDAERGPIGPLKHLAKEAMEAANDPSDRAEYADCLILILDASRRAGITPQELVSAALEKMQVNRSRSWPKPVNDEPVEHVR